MTVKQLSRSGAVVVDTPQPLYPGDERNEAVGVASGQTWGTVCEEPDEDMMDLMSQPEFYEAFLEAEQESAQDAMTLDEAAAWLDSDEDQ